MHSTAESRHKYLLVLFSTLVTGCTLSLTGYAAYISNSVTLLADFVKCFVEFLAIALAFVVVEKTRRSDHTNYNYGFGKLEQLSSTAVAFTMFCSALLCIVTAIDRGLAPVPLKNGNFGLILAALSVIGNGYMWQRFYRLSHLEPSPVTDSQRSLFLSKTLASLVVVLSLSLGSLADRFSLLIYADSIGSLLIAIFLIHAAFTIASDSVGDLVDRSIDETYQIIVMKHLVQFEDAYSGFHGLRSRRIGAKKIIQISLSFSEDLLIKNITTRLKELKSRIESDIPECEVVIGFAFGE